MSFKKNMRTEFLEIMKRMLTEFLEIIKKIVNRISRNHKKRIC